MKEFKNYTNILLKYINSEENVFLFYNTKCPDMRKDYLVTDQLNMLMVKNGFSKIFNIKTY